MGEKQEIIDPWRTALCELFVVDWFWGGLTLRSLTTTFSRVYSSLKLELCIAQGAVVVHCGIFTAECFFYKAVQKKKKNKEKKQ